MDAINPEAGSAVLVEMTIKGLMVDPITNMPIIILRDRDGQRVLPIWVGVFEANAIALQIENIQTPRPMTHDLLRNVIQDLQAAFLEDWRGATLHWLRYGRTEGRLGRVPLIFNVDFYLGQYPDVESVFGRYPSTVFQHYYFFGVYEARIFDNEFRVDEYIALNPDLQTVFGTDRRGAFMYWVRWGRSEGRVGRAP